MLIIKPLEYLSPPVGDSPWESLGRNDMAKAMLWSTPLSPVRGGMFLEGMANSIIRFNWNVHQREIVS